ncbi:MAG: biotin transporter BioY [Lachnospiraceae bacterium]|nr:biotin transporter BioY [Lachnospiraceae bacterium]
MQIRRMTSIALVTAVMCLISPFMIYIPVSPVPVSFSVFTVFIAVYVLDMRDGLIACGLYVLLGLVGLPVFSGFTGGAGKLLGPTGGYIIGYFLIILIASPLVHRTADLRLHGLALIAGVAACYALGTLWLAISTGLSFDKALLAGVIPFIPADLVKTAAILVAGPQLKRAIYSS